jgi:hypothetical protein
MIGLKDDRTFMWLALCLSVALLAFTGFRAHELSFTYDESSTVLEYVNHNFAYIFQRASTATNHILNSVLMKFSSTVFEPSEFVYRLPNLVAHAVYLLFSFLLIGKLKHAGIVFQTAGFILLNFNPYLLDFFSLARGYGLASAFALACVYYMFRHHQTKLWHFYFASVIMAALAAWSNFSALNLLFALIGLFMVNLTIGIASGKKVSAFYPRLIVLGVTGLGLGLLINKPMAELIRKNELFFGGEIGIWSDTIRSLITKTTYAESDFGILVFGVMLVFALCTWIISCLQRPLVSMSIGTQLFLLFGILLLGLEMQHFVFETRFVIERTALFIYPIFVTAFIFLAAENVLLPNQLKRCGIGMIAVLFLGNFVLKANTTHYQDWKYERHTKDLMQSISGQQTNYETHFAVAWPYSVSCKFYARLNDYSWLNVVETNGPFNEKHFVSPELILVPKNDLDSAKSAEDSIIPYGNEMVLIFRKKKSTLEVLIHASDPNSKSFESDAEFIDLFADSLFHVSDSTGIINVRIELKMHLPEGNPDRIVLALGTNSRTVKSEKPRRSPQKNVWQFTLYYQNQIAKEDALMKVFVWNMDRHHITLKDFAIYSFPSEME